MPQNIYSMDEKGFILGKEHHEMLVVHTSHCALDKQRKKIRNHDFITVLETMAVLRDLLSPLIIWKSKKMPIYKKEAGEAMDKSRI